MPTPQEAQAEIMDALHDHFDRTGEPLKPEQVMEMVALDHATATNALRILKKIDYIEGVEAAEFDYPILITGIKYDV
jgi:predicted transcriptional regulator